jgi:hypothetical protein
MDASRSAVSRRRFLRFVAGSAAALPFLGASRANSPFTEAPGIAHAQALEPDSGYRVVVPGLHAQGMPLQLHVSTGSVYQGGALRVSVPRAEAATASILGRDYPLFMGSAGPEGYIGIGVGDPPGEATLRVEAVDRVSGLEVLERPVTVLRTHWTVEYIWLPPGTGGLLDPALIEAEMALLRDTYAIVSERMWEEPWIVPVEAPISSYFGEQRSFNGGPVGGHHGGTDFAAPAGTPVVATNHGHVVVVEALPIRGNMVILDHGTGVLSGYAHLSAFDVEPGMTVQKGQVVGRIGSTGLSTGPHLHWEHAVSGILVDGLRWLDGTQGF